MSVRRQAPTAAAPKVATNDSDRLHKVLTLGQSRMGLSDSETTATVKRYASSPPLAGQKVGAAAVRGMPTRLARDAPTSAKPAIRALGASPEAFTPARPVADFGVKWAEFAPSETELMVEQYTNKLNDVLENNPMLQEVDAVGMMKQMIDTLGQDGDLAGRQAPNARVFYVWLLQAFHEACDYTTRTFGMSGTNYNRNLEKMGKHFEKKWFSIVPIFDVVATKQARQILEALETVNRMDPDPETRFLHRQKMINLQAYLAYVNSAIFNYYYPGEIKNTTAPSATLTPELTKLIQEYEAKYARMLQDMSKPSGGK